MAIHLPPDGDAPSHKEVLVDTQGIRDNIIKNHWLVLATVY